MKNIMMKKTFIRTKTTLKIITIISIGNMVAGFSLPSFAESRYVTDTISVPLRSDKDNQAGVLKNGIVTGTKLKFIREENDDNKNKWSLVVTPDGTEGWIRNQNLINESTSAMKLEALTSSSTNIIELQKQNTACKNDLLNLQATHQTLLSDTESMRNAATSDINMEQENQNMHREFQLLQTERDVLKADNDQLKKADQNKQRIFGGLLILCGVILSFVLQMFGKTKRHSEWN